MKVSKISMKKQEGYYCKKEFYLMIIIIMKIFYEHAKNIYINKTICKRIKYYLELYLKTDVLLLADCFKNYRNIAFKNYGLDSAYYYIASGLSWDSWLYEKFRQNKLNNYKYQYKLYHNLKIELMKEDMLKMIMNNMRAGICSIL